MSDRLIWIWLSLACGPGSRIYNKLFYSFNTLREIYEAPRERFEEIEGLEETDINALSDKDMTRARNILSLCIRKNWGVLTYGDKAFPSRLKSLIDPPVVLYYKGRFIDLNPRVCIAVVGTRSMTPYGEREAYRLSYAMASGGAVVVSGMALGCDAMAANGALDAHAPTVAVLGCGLDVIYPKEHKTLEEHIAETGMILTEFPPASKPEGAHFPIRNRIISGLCQGTVVVEAPEGSGALITARMALMQGRDLFAVPGEVGNPNSAGTNNLIRCGANVVTTVLDVIEPYEFSYPDMINVEKAERAERMASENNGQESAKRRRIGSRQPKISSDERKLYRADLKKLDTSPVVAASYSFAEEKHRDDEPVKKQTPLPMSEVPITDTEKAVLEAIGSSAVTADELASHGFSASDVMSALTILEILGYVTAVPGGRYAKIK